MDNQCWECGDPATRIQSQSAGVEAPLGCDDCFPDWPLRWFAALSLVEG